MPIRRYASILSPSLYLMISYGGFALFGVLFWFIAARFYSLEQIGMGAIFISINSILVFFSSMGLVPVLIRYVPQHPRQKDIITTLFLFSFSVLIVLYLFFLFWVNPHFTKIALLNDFWWALFFFILVFAMQIFQNLEGVFISFQKTHFVLIKNVLQSFLKVLFLFFFIRWGGFGIFTAIAFAALCAGFISLVFFVKRRKHLKFGFFFDRDIFRDVLPFSLVNFLNALSSFLPGAVFPLIVVYFFSNREAGIFYIPWMIFSLWCSCIGSIMTVFLMKTSHGVELRILLRKVIELTTCLAIMGFILFYFWGEYVLSLFRKEFSLYSLTTLKILFSSIFFVVINQLYLTLMNIKKDVKEFAYVSLIVVVSIVVFAFLFIAKKGLEGIAISWLLSNFIGTLYVVFRCVPKFVKRESFF